jgi:CspA family cold shock protein
MRQFGTVKFFRRAGDRYGFIVPDDGGRDVFVHAADLRVAGLGELAKGQRVSFEVAAAKNGKGPKAIAVTVED